MTFLELCQDLAADSGMFDDDQPATTVSQTGRLKLLVRYIGIAWTSIQTAHASWRWMRGEFEKSTVADQQRYDGTDDWSITRFDRFLCRESRKEDRFSIYDPMIGVSDEGMLLCLNWNDFYPHYVMGQQDTNKPTHMSIDPAGQLAFWPVPDKAYTVSGPFMKSVQTLSADDDEPELPSRYHRLIVEAALLLTDTFEESVNQLPLHRLQKMERFGQLERDQLPRIQLAGALA